MAHRFGVSASFADGSPTDLVEVALRRNPQRAHLLVSSVLGKHIPTDPRTVHSSGTALGRLVGERLIVPPALVIGYAETATALGHCVAEAVGADYLHSTRRQIPGLAPAAGFDEPHSHAVGHLLLPEDPALLARPGPLVLVDDELSTGATAMNTIAELHRLHPHQQYLIAALVDLRSATDRALLADFAAQLGVPIDVVALATGSVSWPADFPQRAAEFVARAVPEDPTAQGGGEVAPVAPAWPAGVREGGRHGFLRQDVVLARNAATALARNLATQLAGSNVLVLGVEELMYAPLLVALALSDAVPDTVVRYSTTTRSPVLALDEPGYPIRTRLVFPAHDDPADGPGDRYAYNVAPPAGADGFTDIVLIVDDAGDTPQLHASDGLLGRLRDVCRRVHLAVIPAHRPRPTPLHGPAFGSYCAQEVAWLLTDLSDVVLEAPTEEREEAIQSGGAHYAESLPIEYQPSAEYQLLFATVLEESAVRIAHAVAVVTELVLDLRGPDLVLASLARAGTPVGALMRRWARYAHDLDIAHYAISIVRGRGIDATALRYLAHHHDPSDVMFVDGWTGKGAIARELAVAVAELDTRFSSELAVLADTGSCVSIFGTRDDFLIPSACLNSTVSGLISRTVLNTAVLAPGSYHGAKFYKELAHADVSGTFLDAISARFPTVASAVAVDWPALRDSDRTPTWAGWDAVERISKSYGIGDLNLIKPGVGETTRVLLRRVPWRILVRADAEAELGHVMLLARQRDVPVEVVPDLAYSCVGLIHPNYTRGATGSDGRRAQP